MECHEGLMARRRKKTKGSSTRHKQASNNNMLLDKSLPSLPPNAGLPQSAFSPDRETPPSETYSDTPTELPASQPQKKSSKSRNPPRDRSPAVSDESRHNNGKLYSEAVQLKYVADM
jgi:hypothetical protein